MMEEKKKTIYFAHPFDKWRSKREEMIMRTLKEMGYEPLNPFDSESDLNEKYGVDNYYQAPSKEFAQDIVDVDRKRVEECDEIFCWIPKGVTMIGTIIEMMWAHELGKKITVLCYKPQPFLMVYADKLYVGYDNFRDGVEYKWESSSPLEESTENQ
jgi:nucleoside 2-deoxyribosyltransferase